MATGIPRLAYDWAVLREVMEKYGENFLHAAAGTWRFHNAIVNDALFVAM